MEKKISVIIPCYNVEKLIDRCFSSLEDQTIGIDNLEIILIDDASTDDTWDKILKFETKYPESVMVVQLEINSRQGTARNIGIEYATSRYITFVDSDDWLEKDMLESMYNVMTRENPDLVMIGHVRDDGSLNREDAKKLFSNEEKHFLIDSMDKRKVFILCMSLGTVTCAKLYRKEFLASNSIYYVEGLSYEDHMFALLLYLYTNKAVIIDKLGYYYYVNQTSTVLSKNSTRHFEQIDVDNMVWEECKNRDFLKEYKEELEAYFLQIGFLAPLKNLPSLFEIPPYDFFLKLKQETKRRIPDYSKNKYIDEFFTEFDRILLGLLSVDISETDFQNICNAIKVKKGIK